MSVGRFDVVVVGAGILGLATARRLLADRPGLRLVVFEKEADAAVHQSGHNSGVVHSGVYYAPGSLKARLCTAGKATLERYVAERGLAYERCGKVVIALREDELPRLAELERRAIANGVGGLRRLAPDELREIEPNAAGIAALHAPETAIVDYRQVTAAYADDVRSGGGEIRFGDEVSAIEDRPRTVVVRTRTEELE